MGSPCADVVGLIRSEGLLTSLISHRNRRLTLRLLLNYKNPKSLKVGYWGTKVEYSSNRAALTTRVEI